MLFDPPNGVPPRPPHVRFPGEEAKFMIEELMKDPEIQAAFSRTIRRFLAEELSKPSIDGARTIHLDKAFKEKEVSMSSCSSYPLKPAPGLDKDSNVDLQKVKDYLVHIAQCRRNMNRTLSDVNNDLLGIVYGKGPAQEGEDASPISEMKEDVAWDRMGLWELAVLLNEQVERDYHAINDIRNKLILNPKAASCA